MTRVRFLPAAFAAVAAVAGALAAAPVPKDAGKPDPTPDLKAFFANVGKAVENEKWPAEVDEKLLRDTARVIFERVAKAADQKDRKLPIDFEKLTKADVTKELRQVNPDGAFVIAGNVQGTVARNSVIFASGDVQFTGADNCVIVGRNVRCTGFDNCVIVADEFIRVTTDRPQKDGPASVLVAGQWIRATGLDGTICHVIRPGTLPPPDDKRFNMPHPAIGTNGAKNVIYLNDRADTSGGNPDQQTYLPQKTPIAK